MLNELVINAESFMMYVRVSDGESIGRNKIQHENDTTQKLVKDVRS